MGDDLQFEKAQFDAPEACEVCREALDETWHLANGKKLCPSCYDALAAHLASSIGCAGYAKAIAAGGGVALLCSAAWAGVRMATGYELGIVAVGVGWLVASAMRRVAGRGARGLQIAAMFLIYTAIVLSYVPELVSAVAEGESSPGLLVATLVSVPLAFGLPFMMLSGGVSGVLWFVIVGIAFFRAWRELAPVEVLLSGPITR